MGDDDDDEVNNGRALLDDNGTDSGRLRLTQSLPEGKSHENGQNVIAKISSSATASSLRADDLLAECKRNAIHLRD